MSSITISKPTKEQLEEAKESLLGILKQGDTVYFVNRTITENGRPGRVSLFVPLTGSDGKTYIRDITLMVADLLGYTTDFDRTFQSTVNNTVVNLSVVLWGDHAQYNSLKRENL